MPTKTLTLTLPKHDDLKNGQTVVRDGVKITRSDFDSAEFGHFKVTVFGCPEFH